MRTPTEKKYVLPDPEPTRPILSSLLLLTASKRASSSEKPPERWLDSATLHRQLPRSLEKVELPQGTHRGSPLKEAG